MDARLRLLPHLSDNILTNLAWPLRGITALAIVFVVVGALIRQGGWAEQITVVEAKSYSSSFWMIMVGMIRSRNGTLEEIITTEPYSPTARL